MRNWIVGVAAFALAALTVGPAVAQVDPTCVPNAKANYKACKQQCQDDFTAAKFQCHNVNGACGNACLAGRQTCMDGVNAILTTGVLPDSSTLANCTGGTDACDATFQSARQSCWNDPTWCSNAPCNSCPAPSDPNFQACTDCVDNAQITHFTCRDDCRDSWRMNTTVQSMLLGCRSGFRSCKNACPPPA